MARKKTKSKKAVPSSIEKRLTALSQKLSDSAPKKRGSILLSLTDSGEEYVLEGAHREAVVKRGADSAEAPPLIRITGPSNVLRAVMDGKKEASSAFIAGGIQVSGDLEYLEALLKDLGLLNCQ
jgi:SCP-2 sterol transfer family